MILNELAAHGEISKIKKYLDLGYNINKYHLDQTPLFSACRNSNTTSNIHTVKFLLDNGAYINAKNEFGSTSLIIASRHSNNSSNAKTVKLLLDRGANVNSKTNYGWNALMFASHYSIEACNLETIKILLEYGADPFIKNYNNEFIFNLCYHTNSRRLIFQKISQIIIQNIKNLSNQFSKQTILCKNIWEYIFLRHKMNQLRNKKEIYHLLLEIARYLHIPESVYQNNNILKIIDIQISKSKKYIS